VRLGGSSRTEVIGQAVCSVEQKRRWPPRVNMRLQDEAEGAPPQISFPDDPITDPVLARFGFVPTQIYYEKTLADGDAVTEPSNMTKTS
jgi:hypothetical protein